MKTNVTYDLLIFYDISAKINMDTAKNLILTKVMGRDRSSKELVSNDDLFFSVQGKVVSDYPDIYPTVQVQRLMEIANYKGIVSVNHRLFKNAGVKGVIIRNFKLTHSEYTNEQAYSFDCVAIEEEAKTTNIDTISAVNAELVSNSETGLLKLLRDEKVQSILSTTVSGSANVKKAAVGSLINNI